MARLVIYDLWITIVDLQFVRVKAASGMWYLHLLWMEKADRNRALSP
jgi:hypothetical protein